MPDRTDDDRPRRRRREETDDDDFDDRPRRPRKKSNSGLLIGLIVGGVVLLLLCIIAIPIGIGLMLPAVQKVRQSANRQQGSNNLMQIGLGVHNYHDSHGQIPPPFIAPANGPALADPERRLSWRVGILPYVEQDNLFRAINKSEGWDSPANQPFSNAPLAVFSDPGEISNQTRYRGFVGRGTMFDPGTKVTLANVSDGLSNTLLAIEAADTVPWAQFKELNFTPNASLPLFGRPGESTFLVLMADGSTKILQKSVNPAALQGAITRSGGEAVFLD
jgi:hypothetical protein